VAAQASETAAEMGLAAEVTCEAKAEADHEAAEAEGGDDGTLADGPAEAAWGGRGC